MRETFNWYSIVSTIQQIKKGTLKRKTKEVIFLEQFTRSRTSTLEEMLKESPPAEVEIKTLPPRRVAYMRIIGAAYSYEAVKPAFEQLEQWAVARNLLTSSTYRVGVAWNSTDLTPADKLIYDVCIEIPKDIKPDKWVSVQTLPGGEFAIYHSTAQVQQYVDQYVFMRLFHWLFFSEYRPEGPPYYNVYLKKARQHPQRRAIVDICTPVKPLWD
jgi:AraC family transcriptional regulator